MAIRVSVEPYCQKCPEFEPELVTEEISSISRTKYFCKNTYVMCVHRDRCYNMYECIKEEIKNDDNRTNG